MASSFEPNFVKDVVSAAFEQAKTISSGTVTKAAGVIWVIIMMLHFYQGGAEILSRRPTRLVDPMWWFRVIMVITLFAGYQKLFVDRGSALMSKQMLAYTTVWSDVWDQEWDSIDELRKQTKENEKLRQTELEQKNKVAGGGSSGWSSIGATIIRAVKMVLDSLVSILAFALSVFVGLGLTLLMLVQAFWVLGQMLLLASIGPLCIVFALHEVTSGVFWRFFWNYLNYAFLYLPFLGVACAIGGTIMARVSSRFGGSGIVMGDGTDIGVHLLAAILGPVSAFVVVKGTPAVLEKVFGGGDGGGAGAGLADSIKQKFMPGSKGGGEGSKDTGGGGGGGGGAVDGVAAAAGGAATGGAAAVAAGAAAASGGGGGVSGDAARGAA
jgi:hypothetical protein